jgi:hypothetical protein
MAPIAIHSSTKDSLNAEAESFKPVGNKQVDPYHSATSATAIAAESAYAAHNYHPLPVVFSRAQGVDVWDPEGMFSSRVGYCHDAWIWSGLDRFYMHTSLYFALRGLEHKKQDWCIETDTTSRMTCKREILIAHRKALPRFPLRLQCCQPRSLPPRTRQGSRCPGLKTHAELSRILQRCLPSLRREGHLDVGFRDGPAHEHWC